MAIFRPEPQMTEREKKLAQLLIYLLEEQNGGANTNNISGEFIPLSDNERKEILVLLKDYESTKKFLHDSQFINALSPAGRNDSIARELYLSGRMRVGKTRTMASKQWAEFQRRLFRDNSEHRNFDNSWGTSGRGAMTFKRFRQMEKKLFESFNISDRTKQALLSVVDKAEGHVEAFRANAESLKRFNYKQNMIGVIQSIRSELQETNKQEISFSKASKAIFVISNLSVLYTTRDWNVAGTMSVVAGNASDFLVE
jgi:hypothetical protein